MSQNRRECKNDRLRKKLSEAKQQHEAITEQFTLTLEEKDRQLAALHHRIKMLLLKIRGSCQERIDPDQLMLFSLEELQELASELESEDRQPEPEVDTKPRRKPHGRRPLPKDLPREIRRYELGEEERKCPCCGDLRDEFGVESSEQLEFIPATWKVIQHDRVKYACKACEENVAVSPKPPQPIEKGVPGPGLCALIRCCQNSVTIDHSTAKKTSTLGPVGRSAAARCAVGFRHSRGCRLRWSAE